jgi:hypothetical protein
VSIQISIIAITFAMLYSIPYNAIYAIYDIAQDK